MPDDTRSVSPALRIFLWSRVAIWIVAVIAAVFFEGASDRGAEWDSARLHELGTVLDVWARWDSDWFLRIAGDGYSWPSSTPAFLPLYPFLIAALGLVTFGHPLLAGVVISLVAGTAAFVLLYRLTAAKLDVAAARRTVLFLALAPTSFFLSAVYSESLFLLLVVASFLTAERGNFWKAGALAGLALLTRTAGIALLPALIVFAWRSPNRRRALAGVAVAPALFALYPLLLAIWIGRPLAFLEAQKVVWERHLSPAGPIGGVVAAVQDRQVLDLAVAATVVVLGVIAWQRIGAPYGLYVLGSVALPLSVYSDKAPLLSMQRFVLVAFPAFMALATIVRTRRATIVTATILSAGLAFYVVRWALWYWVA
ncbi:mannosyltransferase family protein [Gaiella sp.]|uniref:mannosyltransferase family protein n=1 Tax=Gaiella sp. TaxID=2663207 RepID=UPI0032674C69